MADICSPTENEMIDTFQEAKGLLFGDEVDSPEESPKMPDPVVPEEEIDASESMQSFDDRAESDQDEPENDQPAPDEPEPPSVDIPLDHHDSPQ
jgi:hypothetical protein